VALTQRTRVRHTLRDMSGPRTMEVKTSQRGDFQGVAHGRRADRS
jgi:hypothetical protein